MTEKLPPSPGQKIYYWQALTPTYLLREQLKTLPDMPTPEDFARRHTNAIAFIQQRITPDEEAFHSMHRANPNRIRQMIDPMRKKYPTLSRPALSAMFLIEKIYARFQGYVAQYASEEAFTSVITTHDVSTGVYSVATGIMMAENEIRGRTEHYLLNTLDVSKTILKRPIPTEQYERELPVLKEEAAHLATLLKQRPDGFSVIDSIAGQIQEEVDHPEKPQRVHRIYPYQVPELVFAGAKYAQRAYKEIIYPSTKAARR